MDENAREGWSEYGRLVLSELERHNDLLMRISEKLDGIKLQQALYEKDISEVKDDVRASATDIKDLKKRIYKIEQGELMDQAIKRYRKWMFAGAFGITASIIIPIADLIIKAVSS